MTNDTDIDFDAAGAIQAAIEQAGGTVREFEMKEVQRQQGLFTSLAAMVGANKERRYVFEVTIEGPTARDIDVDPATIEGADAVDAIAAAATWADDQDMDVLAADLADCYQRLGQQVHGDAHPSAEMAEFQEGDVPGDADG